MKTAIFQAELWDRIVSESRGSKHRAVVVAYVGRGASKILRLSKADTLVVDMSEQSVKSGQTDPYEIEKYRKRGVLLYTCQNLHAKFFIFDNVLIVASSNLSQHSQNTLLEAGLLTKDKFAVVRARKIVKSLQGQPITPEYIKLCKSKYRPPRFGGTKKVKGRRRILPKYSRLWLLNVESADFPEGESEFLDKENRKATKLIRQKKKYQMTTLRWVGNSTFTRNAKVFDQVVQIENGQSEPPSLIRHLRSYRSFDGHKYVRTGYFLETEIEPSHRKWKTISKILTARERRILKRNNAVEIKSVGIANNIRMLWAG